MWIVDTNVEKERFPLALCESKKFRHNFLHSSDVSTDLVEVVVLFRVGEWEWVDIVRTNVFLADDSVPEVSTGFIENERQTSDL